MELKLNDDVQISIVTDAEVGISVENVNGTVRVKDLSEPDGASVVITQDGMFVVKGQRRKYPSIVDEVVKMCDGETHPMFFSNENEQYAEENGVVIVYMHIGHDIRFRGAITGTFNYYDSILPIYVSKNGIIKKPCNNKDCEYYCDKKNSITPHRYGNGYEWIFSTAIPHEKFTIVDGAGKYCEGIVFMIDDI